MHDECSSRPCSASPPTLLACSYVQLMQEGEQQAKATAWLQRHTSTGRNASAPLGNGGKGDVLRGCAPCSLYTDKGDSV